MSDEEPLNILIAGVGGIGTALADDLAKICEYRRPGSIITLVDGDRFEEKNKERQNFKEMGNKAVVKAAELTEMFEETIFIPLPCWIVEEMDEAVEDPDSEVEDEDRPSLTHIQASDLMQDGLVIFAVVDNFKCRAILVNAAKELDNVDVFLGGNDDKMYGTTYHYQRRDGKDVTADPMHWQPELVDPPDRNPGEMSCEERARIDGGTQLVATNRLVSSLLLARTQHCLIEGNEPGKGASIFFDVGDMCAFNAQPRPPIDVEDDNKEPVDGETLVSATA